MDAKEVKIPLGLLVVGIAVMVFAAFQDAGTRGAVEVMAVIGTYIAVLVSLGIVALFIVAKVLDASFGPASIAALKLAAVFIFPAAIGLLLPEGLGWVVALVLYLALLAWLFELDGTELIVCVVVIGIVRWVAGIAMATMIAAG